MKKHLFIAIMALTTISLLNACNDDSNDNSRLDYNAAMVTVKPLTAGEYYFVLDNEKTLYPTNKDYVGRYDSEEGQRAIVEFGSMLPTTGEYDYNIVLYRINDILTKAPKVVTTQEELDKIGDDRLDIIRDRYNDDQIWISGGHLNIQFALLAAPGSKHEMNLIVNQVEASTPREEGYTDVEFRQKATPHSSNNYQKAWVSFRLGDLDPALSGSKGLNVRVRTTQGEIEYYKVEAQKTEETSAFRLLPQL